jgi:hypothetical protein
VDHRCTRASWAPTASGAASAGTKGYLGHNRPAWPVIGGAALERRHPVIPATITPDARHIDPREVARWAQITASNRLIHTAWSDTEGRWINTGDGGATFGGDAFCSPCERTAEGMEAAPGDVPAVVVPDAREVDPREVARWATIAKARRAASADARPRPDSLRGIRTQPEDGQRYPGNPANSITAPALDALPTIDSALIHPDAREVDPREVARFIVDTCAASATPRD